MSGPSGAEIRDQDADREEHRRRLQGSLGDGYELRELIGAGGFAEVYAAWDRKLKREVAVKVLRADLVPSPSLVERFTREAEAVAKLRHPSIVPIYAVGEGNGLVYFIMPRVNGESLAATLQRERRFSVAETRRVLVEAAAALHEAHEAGFVHRDVKPENIMLDGRKRRVLVTDFGIAKAVSAAGSALTSTGMIIGTPHYMSPEQASGPGEVDHRSDQYSLAIVGYRMLTGELPFDARSPQEVIYRQIADTPKPVHELLPEIPVDLSDALARALAKDPAERFPTMEEFAIALAAGERAPRATAVPFDTFEQELERQLANQALIPRKTAAAGAIGLVAFAALYPLAYPAPLSDRGISRDSAVTVARDFLKAAGAAGTFSEVARYEDERQAREFLTRNLGVAETRRLIGSGTPLGFWQLRWFQPGRLEEWKVGVDRSGVREFIHVVEETVPGANLTQGQAQAVADTFLLARGFRLDQWRRFKAGGTQRTNRTDYSFAWERLGSGVPWRSGGAPAKPGAPEIQVEVIGERVGSYRYSFQVPEEYSSAEWRRAGTEALAFWAALLVSLGLAVRVALVRHRTRDVRWRLVLPTGVLAAGFIALLAVSFWSAERYYAPAQEPTAVHWAESLLVIAVIGAFFFGVCLVFAAAGESLARAEFPRSLAGLHDALRGRFVTASAARGVVRGFALGGVLLAAEAAFLAVALRVPGAWITSDFPGTIFSLTGVINASNQTIPFWTWLDAARNGLLAGLLLLFVISLLRHRLKSTALAVAVPMLAGALLIPIVKPLLLGAVGSAIIIGVVAVGLTRFGFIACLAALVTLFTLPNAIGMVRYGETSVVVGGVLSLLLALAPALVPVLARPRQPR